MIDLNRVQYKENILQLQFLAYLVTSWTIINGCRRRDMVLSGFKVEIDLIKMHFFIGIITAL
jgi:hypothetical protein